MNRAICAYKSAQVALSFLKNLWSTPLGTLLFYSSGLQSADYSLTVQKFVRLYGIRWNVEEFFKATELLLIPQKEIKG